MGRGRVDPALRAAALAMRLDGRSYREIQARLGVPKSTLSGWLSDVPLSDEHRDRLAQRKVDGARSRAVAIRASRIRRTEVLQTAAAAEIGTLTERELFLLGVVAYWCEGSKAKPWAVSARASFINSDPDLVRLFGVDDDRLQFSLSIHESADLDAARRAWAAVLDVPVERLTRVTLKRHNPRTVRRNTTEAYIGCLIVRVRRSTDLNRRIAGWWSGIARGVDPYDERRSAVV